MSKLRQAIMKAASYIERHPAEFNFGAYHVPDCGAPGCAIGWIEHFAGTKRGDTLICEGQFFSGKDWEPKQLKFYADMDSLSRGYWRYDNVDCARTLRLYANKFHPAKQLPSGASICEAIILRKESDNVPA